MEAAAGHGLGAEPVALTDDNGHQRHVDVGTHHKHSARVTYQSSLFTFRPHHDAGTIAQGKNGDIEGIADLHETRALVGGIAINGTGKMVWIVSEDAHGPAFNAGQSCNYAKAETCP